MLIALSTRVLLVVRMREIYGPALALASPKLLGLVHLATKHVGAGRMTARSRYSLGDTPMISRNVRLKVPRLVNPTSRQMSVTLRFVSRRKKSDRSTLRRCR